MHLTDLTGIAGLTFASLVLLLRWQRMVALTSMRRATVAALMLLALLLPLNGLSLVEGIRGMVGDLSVTTLVLLTLSTQKNSRSTHATSLFVVALAGLILYVTALGFGDVDFYRFGFGYLPMLAGLLIIAIVTWWQKNWALALAISLAVLAWSLGYYESTNLWDYLLDPLLFIYTMSALICRSLSRKVVVEKM